MNDLQSFVDAFCKCYEQSGYCVEEDQNLPSPDILEEICRTLINVSCMREEGRYPSFRVCFIRPDAEILDAYLYAHAYRFETPVDFNARDLNKLVPALNADMSYLILDISGRPFKAVGIVASYTTWKKIMTREIEIGIRMPRIPNILVNGPGVLEGCFGEKTIVTYRSGECLFLRTDVFTDTIIADALKEGSGIRQSDRLKFLYQVLWRAHMYGHGGHFFIVPSEESCEELTSYKYRMKSQFPASPDREGSMETQAGKDIGTYANLVAGMTLVDGAVILTKDLDLIGFGAETHPERIRKSVKMMFVRQDNTEEKARHFNDYGMRHRACYNFCYDVDGAVAVILSHDGGVEVCTKHEGKVVVYDNVGLPLL